MPDIEKIRANLATLVLESYLYGLLSLLYISTIYFFATRRTLAGTNHTIKHHFTSVVFLGATALFLMVMTVSRRCHLFSSDMNRKKHRILMIYQAFFAFVHLGNASAENAFYSNYAQGPEVFKETLLFSVALLGDFLVVRPTIFPASNHPLTAAQDISPLDNMGTAPPRYYIPNLYSGGDGR
jgi:hypothetical protein